MEQEEVQFILEDEEYTDQNYGTETLSLDEDEYQNLLSKNPNQTIVLKNGQTIVLQRAEDLEGIIATDEVEEVEDDDDTIHLLQDNEFGKPVIYKLIDSDSTELLQNEEHSEDGVMVLDDDMEGIDMNSTDVAESETLEDLVPNEAQFVTNIDENLKAIFKDGRLYLQSHDDEDLQIITDANYLIPASEASSEELSTTGFEEAHDSVMQLNSLQKSPQNFVIKNRIRRSKERRRNLNQKSQKRDSELSKKKLVGKIIDIQKGSEFLNNDATAKSSLYKLLIFEANGQEEATTSAPPPKEPENYNVESMFIDGNGKLLKVMKMQRAHEDNYLLGKDDINFVSKTLSGLMMMVSMQKKLLSKTLYVKLAEKEFNGTTEQHSRTVGYIKGFITGDSDGEFKFFELADDVEYCVKNENDKSKKKFEESITVYKVVNLSGLVSTRVIVLKNPKANKRKPKKCVDEGDPQALRRYFCESCLLHFSSELDMEQHMQSHYSFAIVVGDEGGQEMRQLGAEDEDTLNELVKFNGDITLNEVSSSADLQVFHCKSCDKSFNSMKAINSHFASHDSVKTYVCDVCSGEFTRYSNLIRHLDIHKANGKKMFVCDVCGCTYNYSASLTRHIVQNHI